VFEGFEDLPLRTEPGIVEDRGMADREVRCVAVVGVDDLLAVGGDVLDEPSRQLR